jgi:hypothetical protein
MTITAMARPTQRNILLLDFLARLAGAEGVAPGPAGPFIGAGAAGPGAGGVCVGGS